MVNWFIPLSPKTISIIRIVCGLIAAIHFLLLLATGTTWLGAQGWLNVESSSFLIGESVPGTGSFYRWSILFWYPEAITWVAGAGLLASLAAIAGLGSRVSTFIVWLCLATFHHRAPLLTLLHEPLLVAMFAYLTIDPGRNSWSRPGFSSGTDRITSNVATQLIFCHLWIWIAFSLASMLASPLWWNGEAGWLLIQQGRGWLHLSEGWEWLGQLLTHLTIALQMAILCCMLRTDWSWLSRWMLYLFVICVLLLLGDWLYASVLLAASLSLTPNQSLPETHHGASKSANI
ncbi:MAG: hypothetical protein NTY15_14260 [Planctomycetota bacterium]|nr:hypothetical protein [Planctomycetota bacterium]